MRRSLLTSLMGANRKGAFSIIDGVADGIGGGWYQVAADADYTYLPVVTAAGIIWIYKISHATGQVVDSKLLSSVNTGVNNDHLYPVSLVTPGGGVLVGHTGFDTFSKLYHARTPDKNLANFAAEVTHNTASGEALYVQNFIHASTGKIFMILREGTGAFNLLESTDDGLTFNDLGPFVADAQQMFCTGGWVSADVLRLFINNNTLVGATTIGIAELNVVTGALVTGTGSLGNVRSQASMPSALSAWSALVVGATDFNPSAQGFSSMPANANVFNYHVSTDDKQYTGLYVGKFTGANQYSAADWTFTKVTDSYPSGDAAIWPGRMSFSKDAALTRPRLFVSRNVRGVYYIEQWDAQNDNCTSWRATMHFYSATILPSTNQAWAPRGMDNPSPKLPFTFHKTVFHDYDNWTGGSSWPFITNFGSTAPSVTCQLTYTQPENKALEITLTADQPAGWHITGGADAALFVCSGDKLYLQAKQYLSPADANADNVYQVQVTATSLCGLTTVSTFAVTITANALTASALLSWSQDFSNAAWNKAAITAAYNTADTLDPLGTSLAAKITQANNSTTHRLQRTSAPSVSANTKYTLSIHAKPGTSHFMCVQFSDGVSNHGVVFDLLLGQVSAPMQSALRADGNVDSHGMQAVGNGWYRIWITFTTAPGITSITPQFILKELSIPLGGEVGSTSNNLYVFGAMLNAGDLSSYVSRNA